MRRSTGELPSRAARCRRFIDGYPPRVREFYHRETSRLRQIEHGSTWKSVHDHSRRRTFLVRNPSRKGVAASDPIGRRPRPRGCSRPSMSTGRTDRKKYASWHLLSSYRCWRPERAAGRLSARALGLSLFLHRSMETFHRRLSSENKRVWDVCALWRRCRGLWALGAARRVGAENVVIGSQSTL